MYQAKLIFFASDSAGKEKLLGVEERKNRVRKWH
jgi:hypothetical protein